ncbi:MAG: mannose-1-phosphate guanylyltransferase/mannose-6-phosphate isomerase [Coxiellaceae bacterium]|jgi:mannose-1-phosphate guanylyltransferase|nr:mannose-1-phosphate guanylyltransferase/mannose-6-phosphate isomerase [Coxiellaceae bacterium]
MYLVVLSGGVGSRLWPVSRKLHPKPFIKMPNGYSILQNTFLRAITLCPEGILNVTNNEFLFKIGREWDELSLISEGISSTKVNYILEPFGKNTAAAIAMACLWIVDNVGENTVLLVLPSDHLISNCDELRNAVYKASLLAMNDRIVTFGTVPQSPEIGYGYIEFDGNAVKKFIEKPSFDKAQEFFDSKKYLWNSGMFCFKAKLMLEEMAKYCPDILLTSKKCFTVSDRISSDFVLKIDANSFMEVRDDSIDYTVMEKSDKLSVIPCDMGWSDIGNWDTVSKMYKFDTNGNRVSTDAIIKNVSNCYIRGSGRVIAAIGIENLIIVDTPDALLITHRDNAQDVKNIYDDLAQRNHKTHSFHSTVYRPWGSYTILEEQSGFKIKRIEINPKSSLSLQLHKYRSEHWIVVSGQAEVINDEQKLSLKVRQSTYISKGDKHRLSNPSSSEALVVIEIQVGEYLGEDDIQRFDLICGNHN